MKIDEAIKKLNTWSHIEVAYPNQELEDAIQLGIEALKRCKYADRINFDGTINLLPGETEE